MQKLTNKRILLGVTGSIAAYKAAELIRRLREAGAEVRVVMTEGAKAFVTPLTFQALSGHPVHEYLLNAEAEAGMGHIELARWADAIVVAPASADFIARVAQGRADDLLSAVCLASEVPLALAPAMNKHMWAKDSTQNNVRNLAQQGILFFGPDSGEQACGDVGEGRMLDPALIVEGVSELFSTGSLAGVHVLISAGPTQEALDPVRFLSNHSSGKMGYALASAAVEAGARVTLVSGPVSLAAPERVTVIPVVSASEMQAAVREQLSDTQIFISAAAVADYRPVVVHEDKLKKHQPRLTLELERNPDILATSKAEFPQVFCVGFAAETRQVTEHAREKLQQKNLQMIVANQVGPAAMATQGTFNSEQNQVTVLWSDGEAVLGLADKSKIARQLICLISQRYSMFDGEDRQSNVVQLKT